jgi:Heterokaryon incompatibility protein (HET)
VLWIDQICINQKNALERSQQVNIMGCIYRQAQQVVMWLGEDVDNQARIAYEFIEEIVSQDYPPLDRHLFASDELLLEAGLPESSSSSRLSRATAVLRAYVDHARSKTR